MSTSEAKQNQGERTASRRTGGVARTKVVAARLAPETYGLVESVMSAHGLTASRAVELMLSRHKPLSVDRAQAAVVADAVKPHLEQMRDEYAAARVQLQRIGNNVNQIARKANASGVAGDAMTEAVEDALWEIKKLSSAMLGPLRAAEDQLRRIGRG